MTTMCFTDAASIGGVRITADGYLVADARIARTGIQEYLGVEVGRPDLRTVRIYRPEAEVFHADAMASMAHRPVTSDHPAEAVKADNWKKHAVGMTGDQVARDGGYVRVPLTLMDGDAIAAFRTGKRELSVGYKCTLDWTAGQTDDGQAYDAVQRSIRGNHLALVDKARAGSECRIGDDHDKAAESKQEKQMADRKVTVDGFTFEVGDQAAQAIEKLSAKVADADKSHNETKTKLEARDGELAALRKTHGDEIAARDAKITELESNLDARIAERQAVIADAKTVAGKEIDGKGKSTAEIRRAAVAAALGDAAVADKSDGFIEGSFATLLASRAKRDPVADAVKTAFENAVPNGGGDPQAVRDAAYAEYLAVLTGKKETR